MVYFSNKNNYLINLNLKKKSKYNVLYEFRVSFLNAIKKWSTSFVCRYSLVLEKILIVLWDLHTILGYTRIAIDDKVFFKIFLKRSAQGYGVINDIFIYPKSESVTWLQLNDLVSKNASIIFILSTISGIQDGVTAVRNGLGGVLLSKISL